MLETFLTILLIFLLLVIFLPLVVLVMMEPKSFPVDARPPKAGNPTFSDWQEMMRASKEEWMLNATNHLTLPAWYLPAEEVTNQTIIFANGYHSTRVAVAHYGWLLHQLGYNVLMPAYRGARDSAGFFIGFGWTDRRDYQGWIDRILQENGEDSELALFGISMGASSIMLLAGEELPRQVKCFICDSGYSNLYDEIVFKAGHDYHLPAFPLVKIMSFWSQLLSGYAFKQVDILAALKNNKRPTLFIHGEADEFVPTEMVYRNAAATSGEKEIKVFADAGHVQSYEKNKEEYQTIVKNFLAQYF